MKIIQLWPIPVLLFCFYCLYTLVADSYEVLYQKRNVTDQLQFLGCVGLSDLFPDKTEIDLSELRDDLYAHFNSLEDDPFEWRSDNPIRFEELILNRSKSGGYLVFNRRVCFIANDRRELLHIDMFLASSYEPVLLIMKNDAFNFVRITSPGEQVDQLTVRKMGLPYSDCDQRNLQFLCLNECFRGRFRLSRYFYHSNETGLILLHFSESNRTIQENERTCFGKCKQESCKLVQLVQVDESIDPKTETFEAEPRISSFDFWLQIIGLIFSFVGLFFDQFASTATKLTKKLTRSRARRRKMKVGLFYLNLAIILLSLAFCGYLGVRVALDQQAEANEMLEKARNFIQPKTVHLAICVKIDEYLDNSYKARTMSEIERATHEALDDKLEGIYVTYGEKSFPTDYRVHRKVLFKYLLPYLGRCFPLSIQPNYQTIPSRPKLTIRFKDVFEYQQYQVYVLSEEENLNGKSFQYDWSAFRKGIVKRLKGKCMDYKAKYENCTGRQNCLERCIGRKFVRRYNRIISGMHFPYPAIDRHWFSSSEWNTSQLIYPNEDEYESKYLNISRECEETIVDNKPCDEIKFETTVRIGQTYGHIKKIDLQFDVVWSVEELPYSLRMALDLLGIQSIFFGFTLLQLFWLVYQFIKPRWRLRNDKTIWFFICFFCSLGCSWTIIRMLDVIVNGELVPTEHYEMAERVQMPTMSFCLRINQKRFDRNHLLTGNYLEEMTGKINVEITFKNIVYLNESNEWAPFDLRRVERFFLLDMKCFRVHIDQAYHRNQFHFSDDMQVLRVNFKKIKENQYVYFMTQSNKTAEFSKLSNVFLGKSGYQTSHEASLYEYDDHFGFFRRHFPSLQEGDVDDLHGELLELQSNEPHRRTLSLPVEKEHFDQEVDEDHFEQLYSSKKQKNPNKRTNLNYRQLFVTNHLKKDRHSDFDFSLTLLFLQRVVHFTNEVNYATLMLSLLNLLSLWLELSVLDLPSSLVRLHDLLLVPLYLFLPVHLLRKLIKALLVCSRWLKKLKPKLYNLINSQVENPPVNSSVSDQSTVTSVA